MKNKELATILLKNPEAEALALTRHGTVTGVKDVITYGNKTVIQPHGTSISETLKEELYGSMAKPQVSSDTNPP